MDTSKRTKEFPMTVPELKSTAYLLPEAAWPIVMQNVADTGNSLLCSELTSDKLTVLVAQDDMVRFRA